MFARVLKSAVIASVVAFLAVAGGVPTSTSSCNSGTLQCCDSVHNSTTAGELLGLFGLGDILGDIGLQCTSINVLGIMSSSDCIGQAMCCTNVTSNGLVSFGCSPVNLDL